MLKLKSEGIKEGWIDDKYGKHSSSKIEGIPCLSIPLEWDNIPMGTKSFALVFQDYDNIPDEGFSWIHWTVADIPVEKKKLEENESRSNGDLIQGSNSWTTPFNDIKKEENITHYYGGPEPNEDHEYEFVLYALDKTLDMKKGFYLNQLRKAMEGHILEKTNLKAWYRK